jgi:hypothetical protein
MVWALRETHKINMENENQGMEHQNAFRVHGKNINNNVVNLARVSHL